MTSDSDPELVTAIELTNLCRVLRQPPSVVLKEDAYLIYLLQSVLAAQNEYEQAELKKAKAGR